MKKKFLSSCAAILFASACILTTSGCATTRPNPNQNGITGVPQGYISTPNIPGVTGQTTGMQNITTPRAELYDKTKSDKIKGQLGQMQGIKDPNVIVTGNTAIVGCRTANAQTDVSGTKNSVISRVKQIDPSITNVLVSTSPDVVTRIGTIINNLASNRPAQDTNTQLAKLMQDIMPAAR